MKDKVIRLYLSQQHQSSSHEMAVRQVIRLFKVSSQQAEDIYAKWRYDFTRNYIK